MRAAKVDSNQAEIVGAFRKLGCVVFPTHMVGKGFPDIVVRCNSGKVRLVEIKDGAKPPSARKLTEAEAEFHEIWPVHIVATTGDVVRLVQEWRGLE